MELLPNMQDQMMRLAKDLRKGYCANFIERSNSNLRRYFRATSWLDTVEPRDVKAEMFEICRLLKEASSCSELFIAGIPQQQSRGAK